MKKLIQKIKTWFVLRWKELQSIQRDKKAMKTEREVRKVEFSKKHPVYTIATRVIAVLAALAVAIGFTCVSCRTLKDIEKQSTVTASAETIPEDTSGISAYDLEDFPQFITIDIPSVPFAGVVHDDSMYAPIENLIFPRLVIDIQGCSIYRYSYPNLDSDTGLITSYLEYTDISLCPIAIWYDDNNYMAIPSLFSLESVENNFNGDSLDTFYYMDVRWEYVFGVAVPSFNLQISLYGNGGYRTYVYHFNSVSLGDSTFVPNYNYYMFTDNNSSAGVNTYQYAYYDYVSKFYFNKGYLDGDDDGYRRGYDEGYDLGDFYGQQSGYNRGYNLGISQSLSDVTPWQVIVDGVNKFFGLSILGNSVTIGMIMSIGFGCILFGFAVKIFLGG